MIIVEKNVGPKISFEIFGKSICFDGDVTINLAKREKDYAEHIDICYDEDKNLVIGAAAGRAYVAEIDIPPRRYEEVEIEGETQLVPVPLDIDTCTLSLWAIETEEVEDE